MTDIPEKIFRKKYAKNQNETWKKACWRVSNFIAQSEKNYNKSDDEILKIAGEYFYLIFEKFFIPGGRILANADTNVTDLSNCFYLDIDDSRESIYNTLKDASNIFNAGGGLGINISDIRERGAKIKTINTNGASGPVVFLELFNLTGKVIEQASRRAAIIGIMGINHPDIKDFIHCKSTPNEYTQNILDEFKRNWVSSGHAQTNKDYTCLYNILKKTLIDKQLSHLNISVKIPDEFMIAVENNSDWNLISPLDNKIKETINARDLLYEISQQIWLNGDPGVIFTDRLNEDNLVPYISKSIGVNPCLPESALFLTEKGLTRFKDINVGDKVWDGEKFSAIINKWYSGKKDIYEVITTAGNFIATNDHLVFTANGKIQLRDAKTLIRLRGTYDDTTVNSFDPISILDGLLLCDGCKNGGGGIQLKLIIGSKDHDYFSSAISDNIISLYNKEKQMYNINNYTITIDEFENKRIPERFITGNYKQKISFLLGIYSANGSVNGNRFISLKSSSKSLLLDTQKLLNSIGIFSHITTNKPQEIMWKNGIYTSKESYNLVISDAVSILRFKQQVGFLQKYKLESLNNLIRNQCPKDKAKLEFNILSYNKISTEDTYDFTIDNDEHCAWVDGFKVSNCSEITLLSGESCVLGSVNLKKVYDENTNSVDIELLEYIIRKGVRFLDSVHDVSYSSIDRINEMTKGLRRIGLGVMGFADLLSLMEIPYNSKKAIELSEYLSWFISFFSWLESMELAKEKGIFPLYDKEKLNLHVIDKVLNSKFSPFEYDLSDIKIRNVSVTGLQPTGTISLLADVNSSIEPFYSLVYKKNITEGKTNQALKILMMENPNLGKKLRDYGYSDNQITDIINYLDKHGSLKNCEFVDEKIKKLFLTAHDINIKDHINIQSAWQKYITNAISKTCNLPESASVDDIYNAIILLWRSKVKSSTIYRDKSRLFQILESGN